MQNLQPFTAETKAVIEKHVLKDNPLQGACAKYQSLAERAVYLRDLQRQVVGGKIDLGKKDRAWAIAKCVAVALLVAASVAFCFLGIPYALAHNMAPEGGVIFALPLVFSCAGFSKVYNNAQKVLTRPSLYQVEKELHGIAAQEFTAIERLQIDLMVEELRKLREGVVSITDKHQQLGNAKMVQTLGVQRQSLEKALAEVQNLANSFFSENRGAYAS